VLSPRAVEAIGDRFVLFLGVGEVRALAFGSETSD
jgi:hypothetical protein